MRDILLGIDFGTTVLKAGVFDRESGRELARSARRLDVRVTRDGGREQRLAGIDRTFKEIIEEVRRHVGRAWPGLFGIGLAAQGGSTIIADRDRGRAKTPMLLWNDGRASAELARIAERSPRGFWRRFALADAPPSGLARLAWMADHHPDLMDDSHIHCGAGEYLFHALTGIWRQDAGNAIQIGSYNARKKKLDAAGFRLIGVPLSFVAPLRQGHETAPLSERGAKLLGAKAGIPVAGPYIDQEAGYMAATGVSARPLQCSLGTAWVGNFVLPSDTTGTSPTQIVLPSPTNDGRLVVQPLLAGNVAWDWGLQALMDVDHGRAIEKATAVFRRQLLAPTGLVAFPGCSCPNPLKPDSIGAGVFHGIDARTTRDDLLRALAAGMVFELRRLLRPVADASAIDSVVLGGGASKGDHFRKLIAAIHHPLPVHQQVEEDLAVTRGALYAFDTEAAHAKTKRLPRLAEGQLVAVREAYEQYLAVFEQVYGAMPDAAAFAF